MKNFDSTYLGAAVLSGSDPPMSLQTLLPSSIIVANLSTFGKFLSSPTKTPTVSSFTAFSGTPSRISRGTYNAFRAPKQLTKLLASYAFPTFDSTRYRRGFLQPDDKALLIPVSAASPKLEYSKKITFSFHVS